MDRQRRPARGFIRRAVRRTHSRSLHRFRWRSTLPLTRRARSSPPANRRSFL